MKNENALTKVSDNNQIRQYFKLILKLKESGEEFPVDLDEVWPLVYEHRKGAVASLKDNFLESVDYQVSPENRQNSLGGRPTQVYKLTVPCLEYFIARKVRTVFDVYRKVFHAKAEVFVLPKTLPEALRLYADNLEELENKKEEIALLDKLVDTLEPKAKVYNQISESETLLSLNDAAKSIGIGRNRMMEDLRDTKILRVNNVPYQSYIDRELFEVKIKSITIGNNQKNYPQTFVTGKGLTWLSKRYPKNEEKEITPKVKTI